MGDVSPTAVPGTGPPGPSDDGGMGMEVWTVVVLAVLGTIMVVGCMWVGMRQQVEDEVEHKPVGAAGPKFKSPPPPFTPIVFETGQHVASGSGAWEGASNASLLPEFEMPSREPSRDHGDASYISLDPANLANASLASRPHDAAATPPPFPSYRDGRKRMTLAGHARSDSPKSPAAPGSGVCCPFQMKTQSPITEQAGHRSFPSRSPIPPVRSPTRTSPHGGHRIEASLPYPPT